MRKRVKKITGEIREYGVITMDYHLMDGLLKYACCEGTTTSAQAYAQLDEARSSFKRYFLDMTSRYRHV
jgi:hypothetical protein